MIWVSSGLSVMDDGEMIHTSAKRRLVAFPADHIVQSSDADSFA